MLTRTRLSSIFVLDHAVALDFYVGKLGLEVQVDADLGFMRWLTVAVPGDPEREILLELPGPPSQDPATAATTREQVSKGAAGGWIGFATDDVHGTYARLVEVGGVDLLEEPTERSYGIDFGLRDPFGNLLRISQMKPDQGLGAG